MQLLDALPSEWQDDFNRRVRAMRERERRSRQTSAIAAARKGEMRLDVTPRDVLAVVTYEGAKIASNDKGRTWYFVTGEKVRITEPEALRALRERFNEKWLRFLANRRGGTAKRSENLAYHWGEKSDRVRSWV